MMMKKALLMAVAVVFALSSCGDKDKGSTLTPDENKAKLEEIGTQLAGLIQASDFTGFVEAANYLDEIGFPIEMGSKEEEEGGNLEPDPNQKVGKRPVSNLVKATEPLFSGKLAAATSIAKAVTRVTEHSASDIYMTYTYNATTEEWDETPNDKGIDIIYTMDDDKQVKISIVNEGTKDFDVTGDEGDIFAIPNKATFKMTKGTDTYVNATVDVVSLGDDARTGEVNTSIAFCGYNITTNAKVAATTISASAVVKKGSTFIVSGSGNGNGLKFIPEDLETEEFPNITSVSGTGNVLNKAYLKVSCDNLKKYNDALEALWKEEKDDEAETKEEARLFNKHFNIFMNYDNSDTVVAKYERKAVSKTYEEGETWEYEDWWLEDYIVFPDESKFTFDDYFNKSDFADVIKAWEDLADQFESLFGDDEDEYNGEYKENY